MFKSKINILIIINSIGFGGNESAAFQLANNIDKEKFNCLVLVIKKEPGLMLDKFIQNGINVSTLTTSRILTFNFILEYYQFLKSKKIDNVISYAFNYQIVLIQFISFLAGVKKRVVRVSAMPLGNKNKTKLFFVQILSNIILTKQIAVSNSVKNWLLDIGGFSQKKIVVICNGIENKKFASININNTNSNFNIMMVARMDKAKDFKTLIKAMAIVQKSFHNANLILIGDGPERNNIENYAIKVGCRLNNIGFKNNVNQELKSCTIFVHSSFTEGFPNVILEAMSLSIPVIASDIPPNREILCEDKFGVLFKVGDFLKLSELISDFLINETKRKTFAEYAYIRSLNFDLNRMIVEYQNELN